MNDQAVRARWASTTHEA